jgi:hypothetical protein
MSDLIPGRPATDPADGCPLCLNNKLFKGELIVQGHSGYVGQIAPDLALLCPYEHLDNNFRGTAFAAEFAELMFQGIAYMVRRFGWTDYQVVLNFGYVAGQRISKDPDGEYRHPHAKMLQRKPGEAASNWGLDALIKMVNNSPVPLKP